MSDLFSELMRIAETIENKNDADLIRQAAIKCVPNPKPVTDTITEVHNYGFVRSSTY